MYKHFSVSRDVADHFISLFVNRPIYGMQFIRPAADGSFPYFLAKDKKTDEPIPLNADVVRMHLNGDITINVYSPNPETQRSKWVAIDADFDGSLKALAKIQWELKQDGVEAAQEQSRRGGHLWVFFATPLLAAEVRIYIYNVALRAGVPIQGGGLKQGIEVFPKQDRIEEDEYGNAIRAPMGVHRKSNRRYWFYEAAPHPEKQLAYIEGLKKLTEGKLQTLIQGMSLPEAYRRPEPVPYYPPKFLRDSTCETRILSLVAVNNRARDSRNWVARCPSCARAGRDRAGDNLKIKKADPRFYQCFAGCSSEDIREALGLPIRRKSFVRGA